MRSIARLLLVVACLAPSFAYAQTPAPAAFDFVDGADVAGHPTFPLGENLEVPRTPVRHSLIRVRTEFIQEMTKSVENL